MIINTYNKQYTTTYTIINTNLHVIAARCLINRTGGPSVSRHGNWFQGNVRGQHSDRGSSAICSKARMQQCDLPWPLARPSPNGVDGGERACRIYMGCLVNQERLAIARGLRRGGKQRRSEGDQCLTVDKRLRRYVVAQTACRTQKRTRAGHRPLRKPVNLTIKRD